VPEIIQESLGNASPAGAKPDKVVHPVTLRAVLIGAGAATLFSITNPFIHWVGSGSLLSGPVFALFMLVLVNTVIARRSPARALTRSEVLVVYLMLIVSVGWQEMGGGLFLVIQTTYPFYMATPENGWRALIWPHIPPWLRVGSPEAVDWFWQGLPEGRAIPWAAWLQPASAWLAFAAALMAATYCLGSLLRKDWIERQRLSFPLADVPLAITGDGGKPTVSSGLIQNRIFWTGFAIPSAMVLLAWVQRYFPNLPAPDTFPIYNVGTNLVGLGLPWSVLQGVRVGLNWAVFGVICLIPTETSLSIWFFYVLSRLQLLMWAASGAVPGAMGEAVNPSRFIEFEETGGLVALSFAVILGSWGSVKAAALSLVRRTRKAADPLAPLSARAAVLGFLASNAFILAFTTRAGMSWWASLLLMATSYSVVLVISRLVAAAGVLWVHTSLYGVDGRLPLTMLGSQAFGPTSLVMLAYITGIFMNETPGDRAMPQMMNAFKLAHVGRIGGRGLTWAVAVAVAVVLLTGTPAMLVRMYHFGAWSIDPWYTTIGRLAFDEVDSSLRTPEAPNNWLRVAVLIGAGVMAGLVWGHTQVTWWPVSPVGFVIANGWATNNSLWACAFIGWLVTSQIKRYGGLRLYRTLRPGFLGLVLGEFITGGALGLINGIIDYRRLVGG
jgi:hypothetical protein